MFRYWTSMLAHPKEMIDAEIEYADLKEAAKWFLLSSLIVGVFGGILSAFVGSAAGAPTGFNTITFLFTVFGSLIIYAVGLTILEGIIFFIAKTLGGKGTFVQQYYLVALATAPIMFWATLTGILPFVGWVCVALFLAYWLYIRTIIYNEVHGFGMPKAVAAWVIPTLLLGALVFLTMGKALLP
ncbi:YIP1 family protein [Candidatus Micrarchaeota archaeon]|nr:YIP1 family protein [Candidatus Micrarchaeota archaeon]